MFLDTRNKNWFKGGDINSFEIFSNLLFLGRWG
jgi:hypothetical protein